MKTEYGFNFNFLADTEEQQITQHIDSSHIITVAALSKHPVFFFADSARVIVCFYLGERCTINFP